MFNHNLDPVLFDFGFISIRWYSLAYIFGILLGWWYGKKIISKRFSFDGKKFELNKFDELISYIIISIIIGGRIGYVIFYNPKYYIAHPIDIFKIWEGGMSFHGALVGVILGTILFSNIKKIEAIFLLDIIACVAPIGIFLGRIANFINGELVGKVTNMPWSVVFSNVDMAPRHPSQLYEALLEGIVLFFLMKLFISKKKYIEGICSYMFLILYGLLRIFSEFFREPDFQVGYFFNFISMGTILSIVMVLVGLIMVYPLIKKNEISS